MRRVAAAPPPLMPMPSNASSSASEALVAQSRVSEVYGLIESGFNDPFQHLSRGELIEAARDAGRTVVRNAS